MEMLVRTPVLDLDEGEVVTLIDAEGARIASRRGRVWVTEEGDRRDHIVGEGQAFVVDRPGRTVVQALEAARVAIREPANEED
jgi:hypothetical protein